MGVGVMRDKSLKRRNLNVWHTLGDAGRKNSKTNIGIHGLGNPIDKNLLSTINKNNY
jgi:hypothetical protein